MGGGLFNSPLHLNPKCIVVSAFVVGIYWLPRPKYLAHKFVMSFLLATAVYVLLAWYDVIYDCNDRLMPSLFGWFSGPLKPPYYNEEMEKLPIKYKKIIRNFDIIVLGIVLLTFVYPFYVERK